jgi:short-subunit dehydrogenase
VVSTEATVLTPLNAPIRDWTGHKVWIVGSSSGIGASLAQALLARGARVVLSARTRVRLEEVAAQHPRAIICAFDACDPAAWRAAAADVHTTADPIDLLVYCAADYTPQRIWDVKAAEAAATLTVNLAGVYYGIEVVLPGMLARRQGGIALVASVAGYMGLPGAAVYGPTKAALINLAELLYCETSPRGLGVYLINPGFVATPLTAKNSFRMPALRTPAQAADAIVHGLERGQFEIHFPKRFTWVMKAIRSLPPRLRLALLSRLIKR